MRRSLCPLLSFALLLLAFASAARAQESGAVVGQVYDGTTGKPVAGVTVTLSWPPPLDGSEPRQEIDVSGADGMYRFSDVPPGSYALRFAKTGYRDAARDTFDVKPGQENRADVSLAPETGGGDQEGLYDVEEFVVVAAPVDMESLLLRVNSDELLNVLSSEELSSFAAGDVAEGLQRMAGVNVVEGQFAVVRGLEDRYSSTLYNSAPVPSPDPDVQSVQLDLFPSDVVSNLIVQKTFSPDSPSNSSGGSINILTHDYSDKLQVKFAGGTGGNQNAWDKFLKFNPGSPMGTKTDGRDTIESEYGGSLSGRTELFDRQLRFKAAYNWELDYVTAEGWQEAKEPVAAEIRQFPTPTVISPGGLSYGELALSGGHFDLTQSERTEQNLGYVGLGIDLDKSGNHRLDGSFFYTRKKEEQVQLKDDGYLPGTDYASLAQKQLNGEELNRTSDFPMATKSSWVASARTPSSAGPSKGALWYSTFSQSQSVDNDRDLTLYQLNGDHQIVALPGLSFSWAANHVTTNQTQEALGARYFYEPVDQSTIPTSFPATPQALGDGQFFANGKGVYSNSNDINEYQYFGRFDGAYETSFFDERIVQKLTSGGWWERAKRHVGADFLESATSNGTREFAVFGRDELALGDNIFRELQKNTDGSLAGSRDTTSNGYREIKAWDVGSKTTFFRDVDLLAGVRVEKIDITSHNDPFIGEPAPDGTPQIFPKKYLFFDRQDNPARNEINQPPPYNDQILGIKVPVDPQTGFVDLTSKQQIEDFVNGEIDETRALPALGLTYRPIQGLALRSAYSQTVARPSFREMGYYVTVELASDDLIVGNPQLKLSDVTSYDLRAEYTWGDFGDLAAVSGFYKSIEKPIESIVVRDPTNLDSEAALFRTFFNNPNTAHLQGIELEARKNLGFVPWEFFEFLTIGANYTYIDAKVDRTEAELARSRAFFGVLPGKTGQYTALEDSRRLFGQPEWIWNVDLSFDQPDWGTKLTLAYFAISDVLDAAGTASIQPDGRVGSFTLDRYIDSYAQLDLVLSQTFHVDYLRGDLVFKASVKNLTNSERGIIYDTEQTDGKVGERSYKVGRDLAFSLTYQY